MTETFTDPTHTCTLCGFTEPCMARIAHDTSEQLHYCSKCLNHFRDGVQKTL